MGKKIGVVLGVLGALVLVFGVVWMTMVWPALAKIPAGLVQQVDLEGTMTLFSEEHGSMTHDVSGHRKYTAVSANDDVVCRRTSGPRSPARTRRSSGSSSSWGLTG